MYELQIVRKVNNLLNSDTIQVGFFKRNPIERSAAAAAADDDDDDGNDDADDDDDADASQRAIYY